MIPDTVFADLIRAASLAPSADNMQPWEFRLQDDVIEVFAATPRMLPTDVLKMFTWVSIGAAIQNMVEAAAADGFHAAVAYPSADLAGSPAATVRLIHGSGSNNLAEWIARRNTNRSPYEAFPLSPVDIYGMTKATHGLNAGIHWTTSDSDHDLMARMDAHSSYIRLEHKPLHDELFSILRFTGKEKEAFRCGLDFESLQVPSFAVILARQLQHWSVNSAVSKLGLGRLVALQLSSKLRKSGAMCLVTARRRDRAGYMEAGRAMERLWLEATKQGLSIHPYGVLPQYLTKAEMEPETFLPRHVAVIRSHREPFCSIFPKAKDEYPAIVLRVGQARRQSARSAFRLKAEEITRK